VLLPADGPGVLATDSRYAEAAKRDAPDLELVIEHFIEPTLTGWPPNAGLRTVAFEAQVMTVGSTRRWPRSTGAAAGAAGPGHRGTQDGQGRGRDRAARAGVRAHRPGGRDVLPSIVPGRTERELAVLLERAMIDRGAEAVGFDSIVASGPNGAIPHHAPGSRPFAAGDLITVDCGARCGGYHADMTRTVALGEPAAWQRGSTRSWPTRSGPA